MSLSRELVSCLVNVKVHCVPALCIVQWSRRTQLQVCLVGAQLFVCVPKRVAEIVCVCVCLSGVMSIFFSVGDFFVVSELNSPVLEVLLYWCS